MTAAGHAEWRRSTASIASSGSGFSCTRFTGSGGSGSGGSGSGCSRTGSCGTGLAGSGSSDSGGSGSGVSGSGCSGTGSFGAGFTQEELRRSSAGADDAFACAEERLHVAPCPRHCTSGSLVQINSTEPIDSEQSSGAGGSTAQEAAGSCGRSARTSAACHPRHKGCLLYTSPSPRDRTRSRMPSSA